MFSCVNLILHYLQQFLDAVLSDAQEEGRGFECQACNGGQASFSPHAACSHPHLEGQRAFFFKHIFI